MSFRGRLLLFFMIIVIVPMVAVALVLFSITADSENGKADAAIAQGMRTAGSIYEGDRARARPAVSAVAGDAALAKALSSRRTGAVQARLQQLIRSHPKVRAITLYGTDRRPLAAAGSPDAIAFAAAAPTMRAGRNLALVLVSVTAASQFGQQVHGVTGFEVRVIRSSRLLGSTIANAGGASLHEGNVTLGGTDYRGRFHTLSDAAGPRVAVGLFDNRSAISSSIDDRRLLIGGILAAFLILALLSSVVVVRALQRQVSQFLDAARRLARGDFSDPVPVEGSDEFAALGTEFNQMSTQLRAKIHEVEHKRAELEETIRRVGEAFAAGLDREGIVKLTVRTAVEACDAEVGRALPLDARKMRKMLVGNPSPELSAALEAAERRAFEISGDHGLDWIAALESGDDEPVDQRKPSTAEIEGIHALAVPLIARVGRGRSAEQVGVVTIARRGQRFDDGEVELFAYLTAQAAVSIENADLHETVRLQAVTDELTGLYNLRHFHETLDGEIERSRRFGTDVGVAMLDIDDFKVINDTFGHQQGDLVLIEVGRVLRELSRDIDEPARYGGEEMAVILPQTDVYGAELLAERMRAAIEDLEIERLDGHGHLKVTASFGVASLPDCARDKESLIAEADAALYRAKRAGKNRTRHGEPVAAES
jgi:diguanylate cyclase (GGDEF)-like protein